MSQVPSSVQAALLTPRGRGAVATIRVVGPTRELERLSQRWLRPVGGVVQGEAAMREGHQPQRVRFSAWGTEFPEDVVFVWTDATTLEVHCHGGLVASRRILDDLAAEGATVVSWHELHRLQGGLFETEMALALSEALTERTASILLDQADGVLRKAFTELDLNLDGGNGPEANPLGTMAERQDVQGMVANSGRTERILELLRRARVGLHLTRPWKVVIAGLPNVGKSSLLNRLVGYGRAIVFDQPGTTRDVLATSTAFEGWPVDLFDTAGLRESDDAIESEGISRAERMLGEADAVVLLADLSHPLTEEVRELASRFPAGLRVAHKSDLPWKWNPEDWRGRETGGVAIAVSSRTGAGIEQFQQELLQRLVPEVPGPRAAVPFTQRQVELLERALHEAGKSG